MRTVLVSGPNKKMHTTPTIKLIKKTGTEIYWENAMRLCIIGLLVYAAILFVPAKIQRNNSVEIYGGQVEVYRNVTAAKLKLLKNSAGR